MICPNREKNHTSRPLMATIVQARGRSIITTSYFEVLNTGEHTIVIPSTYRMLCKNTGENYLYGFWVPIVAVSVSRSARVVWLSYDSQDALPYRIRRCLSHPPGGGIPSSIARQTRGCRYRTTRLRKALGEMLPTSNLFGPRHYSNCCGDTDHGKSAERGVIIHRSIRY